MNLIDRIINDMSVLYGSNAIKTNYITVVNDEPFVGDYETIERKGLGHPDSIADGLAADISRRYSNYTIKECDGLILHHQIDKLMIIGGKTKVDFGSGVFVEPIRIIVAGRITYKYIKKVIPVNEILNTSIKDYFNELFPIVDFNHDILVENRLTDYAGPGTIKSSKGAIANMFSPKDKVHVRGYEKLVANDTSYCIAYSPYSNLENAIINVEHFLNNRNTKTKYPWLGSDIKIMAVRNKDKVEITVCVPQIAKYVPTFNDYKNNLYVIGRIIDIKFRRILPKYKIEIFINTKDDYESMNVYLTASGASLSGDIGVVGRGNRTNGLITSNRPMSMEGTNGKNPRYYSGFIYAVATKNISADLLKVTGKANVVEIVSQNGGLLSRPWSIRVVTKADKETVRNIVSKHLAKIENITTEFVKGNIINH